MARPTPEERAEIDRVVRERREDGWSSPGIHTHVQWDEDGQPFGVRIASWKHRRNEARKASV